MDHKSAIILVFISSDLEHKSDHEDSMVKGLRCFAQGCLW